MALAQRTGGRTGIGRPTGTGRPVAREGPVVRFMSDVRRFGSRQVVSDVQWRLVVRSLEGVGSLVAGGGRMSGLDRSFDRCRLGV